MADLQPESKSRIKLYSIIILWWPIATQGYLTIFFILGLKLTGAATHCIKRADQRNMLLVRIDCIRIKEHSSDELVSVTKHQMFYCFTYTVLYSFSTVGTKSHTQTIMSRFLITKGYCYRRLEPARSVGRIGIDCVLVFATPPLEIIRWDLELML